MMQGAVLKNHFAKQIGVAPDQLSVVSIMPCVRKQGEADRNLQECCSSCLARDVDHVITTAELGAILAERGIVLEYQDPGDVDDPLGKFSGGAQLFGTTGGVMEAAVRTVYELVACQSLGRVNLEEVRGLECIKEATLKVPLHPEGALGDLKARLGVDAIELKIVVVHGLGNAKKVVQQLDEAKLAGAPLPFHFCEVMACPGGCICGGGQPRSKLKNIQELRQQAVYTADERNTIRESHENPAVQQLYDTWLGHPGSPEAHEKLHTVYVPGEPEAYDGQVKKGKKKG